MKDTVRVLALILVVVVLSKVPGLRQPEAVIFWLIRVNGLTVLLERQWVVAR